MKFLCLHGACSNPKSLKIQLDPLCRELEGDGTCSFEFAQGPISITPPEGFDEYYGEGPHYRFLHDNGQGRSAMLERVRSFPEAETPEDTLRQLVPGDESPRIEGGRASVVDPIYKMLEADPEIDGIIGYSEGAIVAASLLLDEQQKYQEQGRPKQIKASVFFGGWPPVQDNGEPALADNCEDMVDIPSVHVIGAADPYIAGSMAMYNLFDEDSAQLFDHGKGHTIPRDTRIVKELADSVRSMVRKSSVDSNTSSDMDESISEFSD